MDKILKAYCAAATTLKLPADYIDTIKCLNITLGNRNYLLLRGITQLNNAASIYVTKNKYTMNAIFQDSGIPVPKNRVINTAAFHKYPLDKLIAEIQFPVVAKPLLNTNNGKDVLCNIKTIDGLNDYLARMFHKYYYMLIEEYQAGLKEYQVLLLNNRIINIIELTAPTITGDGKNTIEHLINLKYAPSSKEQTDSSIEVTEECINCLKEQGLTLETIVPKDGTITIQNALKHTINGRTYSIDKRINRKNAALIRQAAQITGLDLVGLDILCEDINKPFSHTSWFVLEANFAPDITLHESPDVGHGNPVSKKILKQLIYKHPLAYMIHRLKLTMKRGTENG